MKWNMSLLETQRLSVMRWSLSSLQPPLLSHLEHSGLLSSTILASPDTAGNLANWERL